MSEELTTYELGNSLSAVSADALREVKSLGAALAKPIPREIGQKTLVMVPDGYRLEEVAPDRSHEDFPAFRDETFNAQSAQGFIYYIQRNRGSVEPLICLDADAAQFRAILDWHDSEDKPGRTCFDSYYKMVSSDELKAWVQLSKTPLSQMAFADFIEDNRLTINSPDAATLLEIVTDLQQTSVGEFKSRVTPTTGGVQLTCINDPELKTSKNIEVPKTLGLFMPLFRGGDSVSLTANLRYRVSEGSLKIHVTLPGLSVALNEAMQEEKHRIEAGTACTVIDGAF